MSFVKRSMITRRRSLEGGLGHASILFIDQKRDGSHDTLMGVSTDRLINEVDRDLSEEVQLYHSSKSWIPNKDAFTM